MLAGQRQTDFGRDVGKELQVVGDIIGSNVIEVMERDNKLLQVLRISPIRRISQEVSRADIDIHPAQRAHPHSTHWVFFDETATGKQGGSIHCMQSSDACE